MLTFLADVWFAVPALSVVPQAAVFNVNAVLLVPVVVWLVRFPGRVGCQGNPGNIVKRERGRLRRIVQGQSKPHRAAAAG